MDLIARISKHLRITKRESEARVAEAHRDGNQIIYGGQRRYDTEFQQNVKYYLAGQPEGDIIILTDYMMIKDGIKVLSAKEIERRAKAVLAKRIILADYDNSWSIYHCSSVGCNKMQDGCCMAYADPTKLSWHRQGGECPTGPYQSTVATRAKKINPLKASKRLNK